MRLRPSRFVPAAAVLALLFVCVPRTGQAQVVPAADDGGWRLWAGGEGSLFRFDYGQQKLAGAAAIVDTDTKRGIGIEGEARWLEFRQLNDVHVETYSIGARYHRNLGKFQPYAKGLIGIGDFNYPYNYAYGRYSVLTIGGGVDYLWKRRLALRAADLEYHMWPGFTFGSMNDVGLSVGFRVRIF